jgi:flagellar motility protein MotE (MotC chaperone)
MSPVEGSGKRMNPEGVRSEAGGDRRSRMVRVVVFCALIVLCGLPGVRVSAQDDMVKFVEAKRIELKEKEENLKRQEDRLNSLRKDIDEKIAAYTKLLARVETTLKQVDTAKGEKLENVVKAYEIMGAEDAAVRLSALDEPTALQILSRMKSKKAGAVIAAMTPRKAAALTRRMTTVAAKSSVQ